MEHEEAIRVIDSLQKLVDTKDKLLIQQAGKLDRRRTEIRELRQELGQARENIGELNSTIVRLESTVEFVRRANNTQALTIAGQAQELTSLNRKLKVLDESLVQRTRERDGLQDQVEELEGRLEDEPDNLALAACKKKLKELEGMLEGQRRSTRELGVNLQRVRDERAAFRNEANYLQEQLKDHQETLRLRETALGIAQRGRLAAEKERDQWQRRAQVAEEETKTRAQANEKVPVGRLLQVLRERDDYLKQLEAAKKRADRATRMIRRAANVLDPVKVTMNPSEGSITWEPATFVQGPVKKATPREDLHQCGGIGGNHHRCVNRYLPGEIAHPQHHLCHCGYTWPW